MADVQARRIRVVAAVVWRDGRVLMTRRPPGGPLGLKWEFPGGKLEPGETAEQALVRELREELGGAAVLPELSMGMSNDFEAAIEEGATLVRIGTALFGTRG